MPPKRSFVRSAICNLQSAICIFGLVSSVACGAPEATDLRKVRVSFNPHLSWGPLMIAQSEGFFRDEGLEVEFVHALEVEETLVALITGDIDVRPGAIHAAFLSAVTRGAPVRIAAGSGVLGAQGGCSYFGIVLRPGLDTAGTDRKSTRLNSSHSQISYAVFCLKK